MEKGILEGKWGEDSLCFGWTALPVSLLLLQQRLGLSPLGINVLLHLLSQWWKKESLPYPSQSSIAERMGVSTRTVQRELAQMKKNGLLKITRTSVSDPRFLGRNVYDPSPLAVKLQKMSLELFSENELKKKKRMEKSEQLTNTKLHMHGDA